MKLTTEAKVGLFTLIGLLLFAYVALFLTHVNLFAPPKMYVTGEFENVTGLKNGNSVRYSGVSVGKVDKITVSPKGVKVVMKIDDETKIPKDSEFKLETDGILGEKFIGIEPGQSSQYLKSGAIIIGDGKNNVDKALDHMDKVMVQAEKLLASINKIVGDQNSQQELKSTITNANQITANLVAATSQLNSVMARNTSNINQIAYNMAQLSQNMSRISTQLEKTLNSVDGDGESSKNLRAILENMNETTAHLKDLTNSLNTVASDQEMISDIRKTIHNTAKITSALSSTGDDSLGVHARGGFDTLYGGTHKKYDGNAHFELQLGKSLYRVGANHIGNGSTVDANIGTLIGGHGAIRGGIFDGDVGAGFDIGVGKPLHLSFAAMDPNDWRYRLRSEFQFSSSISAVAQFNRSNDGSHGGDFFGLQYNF